MKTLTLAWTYLWSRPLSAALNLLLLSLGLAMGSIFVGTLGLGKGGHAHGDRTYTVTGILAPSASVLDRLVLTDTASVWKVHEDYTAVDDEDRQVMIDEREVTMALITYKSPLAAASFPRYINISTDLQAAAPALEITPPLRLACRCWRRHCLHWRRIVSVCWNVYKESDLHEVFDHCLRGHFISGHSFNGICR